MKAPLRPFITALAALSLAAAAHAASTRDNLTQALAGEANAAHRYAQFAQQADREGHPQVATLFRAAARSEAIHRDRHRAALKKLGGQVAEPQLEAVQPGTTAENLQTAIAGENHECDSMYPAFIAQARTEDARPAIRTLNAAMEAEKEHAALFQQALDTLGQPAARDYFICRGCGFTVTRLPSKECPVCRENPDKFQKIS